MSRGMASSASRSRSVTTVTLRVHLVQGDSDASKLCSAAAENIHTLESVRDNVVTVAERLAMITRTFDKKMRQDKQLVELLCLYSIIMRVNLYSSCSGRTIL